MERQRFSIKSNQIQSYRENSGCSFPRMLSKGLEKVVVHHINNPAEGEALSQQIKKKLNIEAPVYPIGPVIGVHVGPGTIGVVYQTKEPI